MSDDERWPRLPFAEWKDTYVTLHMWTQIVGKVRLALSPNINHYWGTTLYVTSRGLTTSAIPYQAGIFEVRFDFIAHRLEIATSLGETRSFPLAPRTVAEFYAQFMGELESLGIHAHLWAMPVEVPRPVRFNLDLNHASYDSQYAHRFWQVLASIEPVFQEFRAGFIGKCSPVHFFWRELRSGGDALFREARAGASRGRQNCQGSILARSDQRGVVAGRRRNYQGRGVLRLRGARADGIQGERDASGEGFLQSAERRILFEVRRRACVGVAGARFAGVLREHLRSGRERRRMESRGARARAAMNTGRDSRLGAFVPGG